MEEITIAAQRKVELLAQPLRRLVLRLQEKWPKLRMQEETEGTHHLFILRMSPSDTYIMKRLYTSLSALLTEHILVQRQGDMIIRLVEEQFFFLDREVKNQLYATFPENEAELEEKCRQIIYLSLLQHFLEEKRINLEGFIDFRLREYWEELSLGLLDRINSLLFAEDQAEILQLLQRILVLEKMRLIKGGVE